MILKLILLLIKRKSTSCEVRDAHGIKNNRPCVDKSGKLWYNSFSDRARGTFVQKVQLSEQISAYR